MDRLRELLKQQSRNSAEIVSLAATHLKSVLACKESDRWTFVEMIFKAALDVPSAQALKNECLAMLQQRFPNSHRVNRLEALDAEASGNFSDASEIYQDLIKEDPLDAASHKGYIAVAISANDPAQAILRLNNYLKAFPNDYEAWQQLASLYVQIQQYEKAAFCFEELLMSSPHNHVYYTAYAEALYSTRDKKKLPTARKYFALAHKLNPSNPRALMGLHLTAARGCKKDEKASEEVLSMVDVRDGSKSALKRLYIEQGAPDHLVQLIDSL